MRGVGRAGIDRAMRLTLLFRAYCGLCDEMLAQVAPLAAAHGVGLDVVDVDAPEHAALEARWSEAVPLLFAGHPAPEHELCRHRFDPTAVEAALRAPAGIARRAEIR